MNKSTKQKKFQRKILSLKISNKNHFISRYNLSLYLTNLSILILLFISINSPVQANKGKEFKRLNISAGQVGLRSNQAGSQRYGLEYRFRSFTGPYAFRLIPAIGVAGASNGARFIYTDLRHDFYLNTQWLLIPSFGIGIFRNSSEINLGNHYEFRSGLELSYQFQNYYRAGVAIYHLSNGGLSSRNPGTEALVFSFSIPIK